MNTIIINHILFNWNPESIANALIFSGYIFDSNTNIIYCSMGGGGAIGGAIGGTIGGTIGGPIGGPIESLTDRQIEVLKLIEEDNKLTIRKLAEKLGINVSAAQGHLDLLKEKGIIERIGGTRGYWRIIIEL